ncbi:RNA 2'-phosphotransferase [Acinetobacter sp. HY1485]|uniref:RNA 2'-phosphotransferase n=1 Tax=Acinetobacter sp. HY1485 TaxID=2970918 RepID=UPI002FD2B998
MLKVGQINSSSDIKLNRKKLEYIIRTNDKKRFQISEDGLKIKAVQRHSTPQVDISFKATIQPDVLYHGTAERFLGSILDRGLLRQNRQYVH